MKEIILTKGFVAKIDDEDYEWLNQWKWQALCCENNKTYAKHWEVINGKKVMKLMHRDILNAAPHMLVDHKDNDGLNNQRSNLRICTLSQNNMNRKKSSNTTSSRYKGVTYHQKKWQAQIKSNGHQITIGTYEDEVNAAMAYDRFATILFGEYARLNFGR